MTIGTIFTLFIVPSLYMLIAKEHHEKSLMDAQLETSEDVDLAPDYEPVAASRWKKSAAIKWPRC
jgi:hypothetical protein